MCEYMTAVFVVSGVFSFSPIFVGEKKVCRSRNAVRVLSTQAGGHLHLHIRMHEQNGIAAATIALAGLHKMRTYLSLELEMKFSIRKILQQQQQHWRRATLTAHKFAICPYTR